MVAIRIVVFIVIVSGSARIFFGGEIPFRIKIGGDFQKMRGTLYHVFVTGNYMLHHQEFEGPVLQKLKFLCVQNKVS